MSAYGSISCPARASYLPPTAWQVPRDVHAFVTLHHIDQSAINLYPGLFEYLHSVFADEVDKGLTYPQEDVRDPKTFRAYFFAADVLIAIVNNGEIKAKTELEGGIKEVDTSLEDARGGRSWDECVAGFYYVKPNYPGRSSHICNAGFVVPPSQRGSGYGRVLARSYLHYAPKLGYRASVFNLVYVNNVASVRLWEKLNFTKAGLIPGAGRLKRTDGPGEEYVDAWVFYKSFEDVNGDTLAL
ncbi:acyl-CoA N-acyltransferase [Gyrodon lividus]|nr:acyl-CoA N-acyltransferase [Gyrodon lividus]